MASPPYECLPKLLKMESEQRESWIKTLKTAPVGQPSETLVPVDYGREQIAGILPHRAPFALLDRIVSIDLQRQVASTETTFDPDDPVFAGHFPGQPIYPGVLQVEMMGQTGLCLLYFLRNATTQIDPAHQPVKGLFTRVHHAGFAHPLSPGDTVTVHATAIEHDDFLSLMAVQVCKGEQICAHSILEAYLVD